MKTDIKTTKKIFEVLGGHLIQGTALTSDVRKNTLEKVKIKLRSGERSRVSKGEVFVGGG